MPALPFADAVAVELWKFFRPARTRDFIILNKDFELVTRDGRQDFMDVEGDQERVLQTWLDKSSQL